MCGHDNTCPVYAEWAAANLATKPVAGPAPESEITETERERLAIFFQGHAASLARKAEPEPIRGPSLPPTKSPLDDNYALSKRRPSSYGGLRFKRF